MPAVASTHQHGRPEDHGEEEEEQSPAGDLVSDPLLLSDAPHSSDELVVASDQEERGVDILQLRGRGRDGNTRGCRDGVRMRGSGNEGGQRGSYEREGVRGEMRGADGIRPTSLTRYIL